MNDINERNNERIDLDMDNALKWSPENKKIERAIMELGYDKNTTMNVHYIKEQYSELDFTSMGVHDFDHDLKSFPNLKVLDLAQNKISFIAHLPETLQQLNLSQNRLSGIDRRLHLPGLLYLNVSSNGLGLDFLGKLN